MENIKFNREALLKALSAVDPAVPSRPTREVLGRVLMDFSETGCSLCATDTEMEIRHAVPGEWESSGKVLLPPQTRQILSEMHAEQVSISLHGSNLQISAPGASFSLPTSDPVEFPEVESFSAAGACQVFSRDLKRGLRRTLVATDPTATSYAWGGVAFAAEPGFVLTLVATDSRRLATSSMPVEGVFSGRTPPHVVPIKALTLLLRCLPEDETPVQFAFTDNSVSFSFAGTTVKSRLLEGRYPNWKKAIPERFSVSASGLVSAVSSVARQSMVVATPESRGVDFEFTENNLRLESSTTSGQAKSDALVEFAGDPLTVRLDPKYVLDCLKVLKPEEMVVIHMNASDSAVMFAADGLRYVLMPLADAV